MKDEEKVVKKYIHKHTWHFAHKEYSDGTTMEHIGRVLFVCPCGRKKIVNIK